ncbi:hypothetical protein ACHAXS_001271 [Conticribra weissflogii]
MHWSKYGADNLALWGFAVKHAVWLYNCIPNRLSDFTTMNLLPKTKDYDCNLLFTCVQGCPSSTHP